MSHFLVIELATIDSTNSEAQRRAAKGERGPVWLRADEQTAGRGRSGRVWTTIGGNLFATLLFVPTCPLEDLHQLSLVTGVAVQRAVAQTLQRSRKRPMCYLKWPNDIMIDQAKVGGILVETSVCGQDKVALVGIGVNIAGAPEIPGREVVAMAQFEAHPTADELLGVIDRELRDQLSTWDNGRGFARIRENWLEVSYAIGEPMSVNAADGLVCGSFAGLAEDGALLLHQSTGSVRRFHFGDVALGGSAADPGSRD